MIFPEKRRFFLERASTFSFGLYGANRFFTTGALDYSTADRSTYVWWGAVVRLQREVINKHW